MTTRVDFYLISAEEEGGTRYAACRLTSKAYQLGHRVYILTGSPEETTELDNLLWTFSAGSFIPHRIHGARSGETPDPEVPVLIGHQPPPEACSDVLISLSSQIPDYYERFARVAELVPAAESERSAARERFKFYRDRGCAVQTHNL
jgi:DNA polymerase III subunit chi